jgi:predicted TIM-barrel fold metal-dependent hydrolase
MPDQEAKGQDQTKIKIIDAHCHIASGEHIPKSFIKGSVANMVASFSANGLPVTEKKLLDMFDQKMQDPLCDALVAEMSAAGISKSVLLIADFTFALKDCVLTIEESFQKHREVLARHPDKFEVFGGVDPRWGKDGLALFERSITEFGFRGFKLYPPCGYSPSDPALFPFYELCAHHRLPVLLHTGPTSPALSFTTANPYLIDEAAHRFPTVNFILAHGATAFTNECADMCRFRPNVFLDVSAFQTMAQQGMGTVLKKTFSQGINHKVLFGTDWPVFRLQGNQQAFVEAVLEGDEEDGPMSELNPLEKSLILHKNIERLLAQHNQPPA